MKQGGGRQEIKIIKETVVAAEATNAKDFSSHVQRDVIMTSKIIMKER